MRFLAAILAAAMSVGLLAGCGGGKTSDGDATYTYNLAGIFDATTWNPHEAEVTYYISDYTEIGLWQQVLNDTADGYEWVPEMAVGEPEDVTADYAGNEIYGVPEDATEGYAYKITLNPDAKWEDGTAINADSYVYSLQQLLNPEMNNYNASSYYKGLPIANAENYAKSGQTEYVPVADPETYEYAEYGDAALYISFTQPSAAFWGYSAADYYSGMEDLYVNEAGEDLMEKYGSEDYVPVTDEVIADVNYMLAAIMESWEYEPVEYLDMAFYEEDIPETSFDQVGVIKSGDYELVIVLYSPMIPYFFKYYTGTLYLVNEELYEAGKQQTGDMVKTNYGTSVDTYMSFGPYKLTYFQADKEWRCTRNENWYGWTDGKHEGLYQATDIVYSIVDDKATQEQLFLQGKADSFALNANTLPTYQNSDYIAYSENSTINFLNINNDYDALAAREEEGVNKTILTYDDFRKGISLSIDRMEFTAQQGYGKQMLGMLSDYYVYDVETGERYRDSEPAQETLKTYYGVDDVDEITGYDLEAAKECLVSGYEQALADGVVSETDSFVFDYPTWTNDEGYVREVNFIQQSLEKATEGTALEGRITVNMVVSEDYYGMLDSGEYDICTSGWNGNASDPYDLLKYFVDPSNTPQINLGFDPESETLDIEIDGTVVTHTYYDWWDVLCNGEYAIADTDTRNQILASVELALMQKYRDNPFWSNSTAYLLSMKIAYPTYDSVFEVEWGGIRSMTFNYTDEEWEAFCKENNYQLNYQ